MNVLITPNFNNAMKGLSSEARAEVLQLFSLATSVSREELARSPLLTRLEKAEGDLYTLRTSLVRVFCTFDPQGDLLFLDVQEAKRDTGLTRDLKKKEVTLFGPHGDPKAYIATREDSTIYSFDGKPMAYIDEKTNIYGFNGKHLGWFEDGIVWDHGGQRVGFTASKCPAFKQFEPFKGFKQFKPFKAFKEFAPSRPFKSFGVSDMDLLAFLEAGTA